ncbi:MAG TPA: tRNA epoxyqueuosine(34) reductase QueG [Roseiarcus sp.]|nr:tRNA epoxyqueuosine(34) reductase QueG [Roseiarcus sp.]
MRAKAHELGFDLCGITRPIAPNETGERLAEWIADGRHGDMTWMAETLKRRADPRALWSEAKSVIMLGLNYGPASDPMAGLAKKDCGVISVYARNRDYHDVMKGRLKLLAAWLVASARPTSVGVKVFVDTAPVMEKPLAAAAGVGWQGKHTNLVSRDYGSWLFLGALFTDLELAPDASEPDYCGTCRACLDVCPTNAFPAPYQLDARRCISYLTIEHKGHIAREFRAAIGNRIYGCDDCLAVCPWNKFAKSSREAKFAEREELSAPRLVELAALDDEAFRTRFAGGPIKRLGHIRFLRNVLIAIGNSGAPELTESAVPHLTHSSPLVRAMAVWALARLTNPVGFALLQRRFGPDETDAAVLEEWRAGGARPGDRDGQGMKSGA